MVAEDLMAEAKTQGQVATADISDGTMDPRQKGTAVEANDDLHIEPWKDIDNHV